MANLQTILASTYKDDLILKNPVIAAAGTFGYGVEFAKIAEVQRLGAVVTIGTTSEPRHRRPHPGIVEMSSGVLYAHAPENPGRDVVHKKYAPIWEKWQTPVILNVAGNDPEDVFDSFEGSWIVPGISAIEIPTTLFRGIEGARHEYEADEELLTGCMKRIEEEYTSTPVIIKLSPTPITDELLHDAEIILAQRLRTISLVDGFAGMSIDIHTRKPRFPLYKASYAGPAIKPIALHMVYELEKHFRSRYPDMRIIGGGGIVTAEDALEFLMAGACAVQVGSANLANPRAAIEIVEGIDAFLDSEGVKDVKEIIGVAQR